MKRLCAALLSFLLLASLCASVSADVIWVPYEDSFYDSHYELFHLHQEQYYVNSPSGAVSYYDMPGGKVLGQIPNGTQVMAYYLCYGDGVDGTWGEGFLALEDHREDVYFPMEHLIQCYDTEFFDDNAATIADTLPEGFNLDTTPLETVLYWNYPGGKSAEASFGDTMTAQELAANCHSFYTDPNGRVWGHSHYLYGVRNSWYCLSDPSNAALAEPERFTAETLYFDTKTYAPSTPVTDLVAEPEATPSINPLAIILPVAAVLIAAALLLFWPKKKNGAQDNT